jgi:hypothetical protein
VVALLWGGFSRRSAGAFGEIAFGQGLQSPGDAFDQPGTVAGFGGLAEQLGEALPQLAHTQPLERRDLVDDVHFHRDAPFACWGQRSTGVDSEPQVAAKCKAIRDKKERFIMSRKVAVSGRILATTPSVEEATGG